jgi:hypothetical protein
MSGIESLTMVSPESSKSSSKLGMGACRAAWPVGGPRCTARVGGSSERIGSTGFARVLGRGTGAGGGAMTAPPRSVAFMFGGRAVGGIEAGGGGSGAGAPAAGRGGALGMLGCDG